jgi:hypothetical protein
MVPDEDVATAGHSSGEVATGHDHLAFWVEDLAVDGDERGPWAPYVGKLWDAAPVGSFESVPYSFTSTCTSEMTIAIILHCHSFSLGVGQ